LADFQTGYDYCGDFPGCYRKRLRAWAWRNAKTMAIYFFMPCAVIAGLGLLEIYVGEVASWGWILVWSGIVGTLLFTWMFFSVTHENRSSAVIVPYFEKRLLEDPSVPGRADTDPHSRGKELAKHCRQLDGLAVSTQVYLLSHFGFADDFEGEEVTWHDAGDGIHSMAALLDGLDGSALASAREVKVDLQSIAGALQRAQEQEVRFCLILRNGRDNSIEKRKGSLW
jgi:hypothetical protein